MTPRTGIVIVQSGNRIKPEQTPEIGQLVVNTAPSRCSSVDSMRPVKPALLSANASSWSNWDMLDSAVGSWSVLAPVDGHVMHATVRTSTILRMLLIADRSICS